MTPEEAHAAAVEDAAGDAYRAMVYGADASLATDMAAAATRGTNAAVHAYLAAMERQGFVMVPVEPTVEMLQDGHDAYYAARRPSISGMTIEAQTRAECARESACYRAMLAALPKVE